MYLLLFLLKIVLSALKMYIITIIICYLNITFACYIKEFAILNNNVFKHD